MTFFVRRLCKKELNLNFFLMRAMGFSVNNNQEVLLRNIFFIFFFKEEGIQCRGGGAASIPRKSIAHRPAYDSTEEFTRV